MLKVLIIDDEPDLLRSMGFSLESAGYRVVLCVDSRQAVAEAERFLPDLLITDLMMPHLSGYEVMVAMRESSVLKGVPLLLMSSVSPAAKQSHFGWAAFLQKPFDTGQLIAQVRQLIG